MKGNLITIYMWPSWDYIQSDNNINTEQPFEQNSL